MTHLDFYVYALFREDGTPFYIGKGRGNRINIHERDALRFTSHKDRIIQNILKAGLTIGKAKLVEGLSDPEAKDIERVLIWLIGRWPNGPLANLTAGGDGVADLSPESRAKKSAANVASWQDPSVRKARCLGILRAKAAAGRRFTYPKPPRPKPTKEETRAKRSSSMKAAWADQEVREKRCAASQKFQSAPEHREKRRSIAKVIWSNPEFKGKTLAAMRAGRRPISEAERLASSQRLNTTEATKKRAETSRDPAVRAKRIAAQRAAFSTPEAKAKRSEASKKMWAAKKAHQNALEPPMEIASQPPR